jgi:hypothetical protein
MSADEIDYNVAADDLTEEVAKAILELERMGLVKKARDANGAVVMRGGQVVWVTTGKLLPPSTELH